MISIDVPGRPSASEWLRSLILKPGPRIRLQLSKLLEPLFRKAVRENPEEIQKALQSKTRRRALTLPLPIGANSERSSLSKPWQSFLSVLSLCGANRKVKKQIVQTTLNQNQSPLFSLPFELREMIWKEVLDCGIIHITHLEKRLGHVRCNYLIDKKWEWSSHDCWGRGCRHTSWRLTPSLYVGPIYDFKEPESPMGLVKTCRAIYSETINLLYSVSGFDFRYPYSMALFWIMVPRPRLSLITSLQLTCDVWHCNSNYNISSFFPGEVKTTLEDICEALSRLKNLRLLRIEHQDRVGYQLSYQSIEPSAELRRQAIKSFSLIRQTEVFEVKAPFTMKDVQEVLGAGPVPFTLEDPSSRTL